MATAQRSTSLFGALIGALIFFVLALGAVEFGIAWLYLESEGYYDPAVPDLIETVAEPLREIDPDFAYADPLNLVIGQLLVTGLFLTAYFLPTVNARRRGHGHSFVIFVLNLLFGATGIGWLIALIWSSLGGTPATSARKGDGGGSWREHLKVPKRPARRTSKSPRRHKAATQPATLEQALADRQPAVVARDRGPTIVRR